MSVPCVRDVGSGLVERDHECAVLRAAVRAPDGGSSRLVIVRGEPGTGRSSLLGQAVVEAERAGVAVAFAHARHFETAVPLGVLAQLFSALPDAVERDWTPVNRFGSTGRDGLVRLCSALLAAAWRRPLALVVDDLHWIDPESAEVLRMLVRRLHHAPIAVIVATSGSSGTLADDAVLLPDVGEVLRLRPLSEAGVRRMCHVACGAWPDPLFVRGAVEATGGRPRLLMAALEELALSGVGADGESATAFAAITASHRAAQVTELLDGLSGESLDLLRALAITGDDVEVRFVRSIAGAGGVRADASERLRETGLVVGRERMRLADPVVVERVLSGMTPSARQALHASAARLAHRVAAPDDVVARILLGAPPVCAPWVPGVLRRAARRALRAGHDADASALLERALREPLPPAKRSSLVLDLASAQVRDRPEASDRSLAGVVAGAGSGLDRVRAADLLLIRGEFGTARRVLTRCLGERSTEDSAERDVLAALHAFAATALDGGDEATPGARAGDPVSAGIGAWLLAAAGVDVDRARVLARAALAPSIADQPLTSPRLAACSALVLTDDVADAEAGLATVLADARRRGVRVAAAAAMLMLASAAQRVGRLDEAASHLDESFDVLPVDSWAPLSRPLPVACRVLVDLERGRIDDAERALATELPLAAERGMAWSHLLHARGALRLATGDPQRALRDLRECGRRLSARRWDNPVLLRWRPRAAEALLLLGDADGARALLAEERRAAAMWGTPTGLGSADLASGTVFGDELAGADRIERAECALRRSPARLLHAEAVVASACLLVALGRTADALSLLEQAERTARDCGAAPLVNRIHTLLAEHRGGN